VDIRAAGHLTQSATGARRAEPVDTTLDDAEQRLGVADHAKNLGMLRDRREREWISSEVPP
jgi:hypothetical protein